MTVVTVDDMTVLRHLNLKLVTGCLVGVAGEVGAGKSSLLLALMEQLFQVGS